MSLYLIIIIAVISVPLLLSFEKNLKFYRKWKYLFPAILIVMIPFLIWDYYFTAREFWGFNPRYLSGLYLFELPVEEILFFVVVPYASLFGYYAIRFHFPEYRVNEKYTSVVFVLLLFVSLAGASASFQQPYTLVNFIFFTAILLVVYVFNKKMLQNYFAIFPVLLIPFFLINGILTGTGIESEVVWYNPDVFSGMRVLTIPAEDFFFAFTLILSVLFFTELLQKKNSEA